MAKRKRKNEELYSPYEWQSHAEPAPRGLSAFSACLILIIVALLGIIAAGAILFLANDGAEIVVTNTPAEIIAIQATDTPAPTLSPTTSPSPTNAGFINTPTPAATQAPSHTPRPTTEQPQQGDDCLLQAVGLPPVLEFINIAVDSTLTTASILLDNRAGGNYAELSAVLRPDGDASALIEIEPRLMDNTAVIESGVTLTLNDQTLNLNNTDSSALARVFEITWQRERPRAVTEFSATWQNTARQPSMAIDIRGAHPPTGGILVEILWAQDENDTVQSSGVYRLCAG